jgi:glutaminyl-tRNA synthetase
MKANRDAGKPSRNRDRPVEENLRLFEEMRMGLFAEGEYSLRAKIDYKHANTTLRDPVIYRIRYAPHPHAKDKWCIYPLYDFTHPLCDSLEGISHSLCSLEFEIRRELYYWFLEKLNLYKPNVWEYSRLNITNTVLSKRTLHRLIFENLVDGWDDPRVLTINGMRRRGYPAEAINSFCDSIGVTRRGN